MTLDYFYGQAGELFSFFRIPKALFQEQRFQDLSTDAKTLYGILLDRMSLSVKNEWFDKKGRVFIIFTIEDVKRTLRCADNKATRLLRELEKFGLIERKRRGQVQRFVRLTNLVPELLDMVDEKKISFNPAVELSYLDEKQQQDFLEAMDASQNAPSLSQAIRIKKLAQQGEFDYDAVYDIMNEEKKSELDTVTIKNETLRKYFPRNYTPRQMENIIIKLLDQWQLKKQQAKQKKQEEAR
mgnify:CR=1 FL=1|jgi:hypothetical protein